MGNLEQKSGAWVAAFTLLASIWGRSQPVFPAHVTADFQNLIFVSTPPGVTGFVSPAVSFFSGSVSPAGRLDTPTDGVRFLEISSFGFPFVPNSNRGLLDCSEGSDYRAWAIERFGDSDVQNPGLAFGKWGPAADHDGDGRDNLMEYALGSNPLERDGEAVLTVAFTGEQGNSEMTIWMRHPAADNSLDYVPSVSGDLVEWFSDSSHVEDLGVTSYLGVDWKVWRDLTVGTPGNPRFFRLQVQHRHSTLPVISLAEPRPNSYFVIGDSISISASAYDLESCIKTIEFYGNGVLLGSGTDGRIESDWPRNHVAPLAISARAVDAMGNVTVTPTVTILPNFRPIVNSVQFSSQGNFHDGREITAVVAASDRDGNSLVYQLWSAATPLTTVMSSSVLTWQPRPEDAGSKLLTMRVTDSRGAVALLDRQLYVFRTPPAP